MNHFCNIYRKLHNIKNDEMNSSIFWTIQLVSISMKSDN